MKSEKRKVLSGVPQDSVFGPLLSVLYINELPEVFRPILYLFADDTELLKTVTSLQDSILLQNDINALEKWSKIWLLRFHPKKCHLGSLKTSNTPIPTGLVTRCLNMSLVKKISVLFSDGTWHSRSIFCEESKLNS